MSEEKLFSDKLEDILEEYGYACFKDEGDDVEQYIKAEKAILELIREIVPEEKKPWYFKNGEPTPIDETDEAWNKCRQAMLDKLR